MLGKLLRHVRAGKRKLMMYREEFVDLPETIQVTSQSFVHEGKIPIRITQLGESLSPAIEWQGLPANTCDIMVIMEDPDAPLISPFVHTIVYNLCPQIAIPEGAISNGMDAKGHAWLIHPRMGKNSFGKMTYIGPGPLPGHGIHHYYCQVFALDFTPTFSRPPSRQAMIRAIRSHVLAKGFVVGTFER